MQWLRSRLCPCRFRASPPSIPTTSQTFQAEDNDWEVIFESSGHEAGVGSTSARQSQPARNRSRRANNLLDPRDPRRNAACWPCFGQHVVQKGSNQYGSWTKCTRCSVRLSYQSKENGTSSSQSEDEVQVIAAALARLRRTSANDEISADRVNAMIKIIQGERALTAASLSQ